jgi:hypothetical protein
MFTVLNEHLNGHGWGPQIENTLARHFEDVADLERTPSCPLLHANTSLF